MTKNWPLISLMAASYLAVGTLYVADTSTRAPAAQHVRRPAPPSVAPPGSDPPLEPLDLLDAYDNPTLNINATIAVIGYADSNNFESDLNSYREAFGGLACDDCFSKVDENGSQQFPTAVDEQWIIEETLDLDMISVGCPTCKILLVEINGTADSDHDDIYQAIATAAALGASAATFSGGIPEFAEETTYDDKFKALGIGIFAATGDGPSEAVPPVAWPAVSTAVTGVGGTVLTAESFAARYFADGDPRYFLETGWVAPNDYSNGAGWGCSAYEPMPAFQSPVAGCSNRIVGDISAVAGTEVWTYVTMPGSSAGSWMGYPGTSVATPLNAAIFTQAGAAHAGPAFSYGFTTSGSVFIDVEGNATGYGICGPGNALCNAVPGYDSPTGNGAPDGAQIGGRSSWQNFTPSDDFFSVIGGVDSDGTYLYMCRAPYAAGLQLGKTRAGNITCDIGIFGEEIYVAQGFESLQTGLIIANSLPSDAMQFRSNGVGGLPSAPCALYYNNSLVPGTALTVAPGYDADCVAAYGGEVHYQYNSDYYLFSSDFPTQFAPRQANFPIGAIRTGTDSDGTPLYVCEAADADGNLWFGKTRADWNACDVPINQQEVYAPSYDVLLLQTAPSPSTNSPTFGYSGDGVPLSFCQAPYAGSLQIGSYVSAFGECSFAYGGTQVNVYGADVTVF